MTKEGLNDIHLAIEIVGTKGGGGATVLKDLLPVLLANFRFKRITVFVSPRACRDFDITDSERIIVRERPQEERSYMVRIAWYCWGFARACRRAGVDVMLCANGMGFGSSPTRVTMVQQALPYCDEALARLPFQQRWRMGVIRHLTCAALRSATAVVAQSPAMAETLRSHCSLSGVKLIVCSPTVLARSGRGGKSVRERMQGYAEGRRLLYVGSMVPYKNVDLIAHAMSLLRKTVPGATLFLTCDPQHPLCDAEGVVGLGYLNSADLNTAYEMTTVVVQPSLIESGPLVPPEAIMAGRPLLVADRPWAHDACGGSALYFEPDDAEEFVAQAERLFTDPRLRAQLTKCGANRQVASDGENSYKGLANLLIWAFERGNSIHKDDSHV